MKTPLGRVRGLGSAGTGTEDFWRDRLRALGLLILTPYMIGIGLWLYGRPLDYVQEALRSLWVAPFMFVFISLSLLHMRLGMATIIEDYIHHKGALVTLLFLNWFFCLVVGAVALLALLKLFFS